MGFPECWPGRMLCVCIVREGISSLSSVLRILGGQSEMNVQKGHCTSILEIRWRKLSYRRKWWSKKKIQDFLVKNSKGLVEVLDLIYSLQGNVKAVVLNPGSIVESPHLKGVGSTWISASLVFSKWFSSAPQIYNCLLVTV